MVATSAFSTGGFTGGIGEAQSISSRQRVTFPDSEIEWLPQIITRLEELVRLERGWDGYKGQSVSSANANFALQILRRLGNPGIPAPQIVPGTGGDLQVEWHSPRVEIELHILAPYHIIAWVRSPEKLPEGEEFVVKTDITEIALGLKRLRELLGDRTAA